MMISIKEIAEQAGVSRTTVSNVIHGKTKKVSQETIDKITKIMAENHFVPTTISEEETESAPKIIGMIVYHRVHGMVATQDTFVGEILGTIEKEIRKKGYYLTLISAETSEEVLAVANAWNVHGLIALGYPEEAYKKLKKKLRKLQLRKLLLQQLKRQPEQKLLELRQLAQRRLQQLKRLQNNQIKKAKAIRFFLYNFVIFAHSIYARQTLPCNIIGGENYVWQR